MGRCPCRKNSALIFIHFFPLKQGKKLSILNFTVCPRVFLFQSLQMDTSTGIHFYFPLQCCQINMNIISQNCLQYVVLYFSYAFGVLISIPVVVILLLKTNLEIFQITGVIFCILFALSPLLFRYSRSVWLHIFVWYDKDLVNKIGD